MLGLCRFFFEKTSGLSFSKPLRAGIFLYFCRFYKAQQLLFLALFAQTISYQNICHSVSQGQKPCHAGMDCLFHLLLRMNSVGMCEGYGRTSSLKSSMMRTSMDSSWLLSSCFCSSIESGKRKLSKSSASSDQKSAK